MDASKRTFWLFAAIVNGSLWMVAACDSTEITVYSMTSTPLPIDDAQAGARDVDDSKPPPWLISHVKPNPQTIWLPISSEGNMMIQEVPWGYHLVYSVHKPNQPPALAWRVANRLEGPWTDRIQDGQILNQNIMLPSGDEALVSLETAGIADPSALQLDDNFLRIYYQAQSSQHGGSVIAVGRWNIRQPSLTPISRHVIVASRSPSAEHPERGVGMPHVIAQGNQWFMLYTDDSVAPPEDAPDHVAHFVLRSPQDNFQGDGVERWSKAGFVPLHAPGEFEPAWFGPPSSWLYSDVLGMFVVLFAHNTEQLSLQLRQFHDLTLVEEHRLPYPTPYRQIPRLIGRSNGHLSNRGFCQRLALDIFLGTTQEPDGSQRATVLQFDMPLGRTVDCSIELAIQALHRDMVVAPERMAGLIYHMGLTTIASTAVQQQMRAQIFEIPVALYDSLPHHGHIAQGESGIQIAKHPGRLVARHPVTQVPVSAWTVSCMRIIHNNQATVMQVDMDTYHSIPVIAPIYCLYPQ